MRKRGNTGDISTAVGSKSLQPSNSAVSRILHAQPHEWAFPLSKHSESLNPGVRMLNPIAADNFWSVRCSVVSRSLWLANKSR